MVLPLAISFYTFEQISYLVDSFKGQMIKHSFLEYLFLISFFPRLIAGPIIQPRYMLQQDLILNYENFAKGITIFVIGLFKKVTVADYFATFVDKAYVLYNSSSYSPGFVESWSSSVAYALQIYFDFSGYSDMAIGLALIFGIRLPLNFDSPYKNKSIVEFWRRWHISLSSFLRDYLYIPLGGNKKGALRKYGNLLIVMLLGGIWHGANLTFLVWGFIHGSYLIINNLWSSLQKKFNLHYTAPAYQFFCWALTFCSVLIGWVYFRSESLRVGNKVVLAMLGANHAPAHAVDFPLSFYFISALTLLFCYYFPHTLNWVNYPLFSKENKAEVSSGKLYQVICWRPNLMYAFFITTLFLYCLLLLFPLDSRPPFIYFNF